jgi:hypothetical protein
MKQSFGRLPQAFIALTIMVYVTYLLKTIMGINVSNHYSAPSILKLPLKPVWSHKAELCAEFQPLCALRSQIMRKVNNRIEQAKRAV